MAAILNFKYIIGEYRLHSSWGISELHDFRCHFPWFNSRVQDKFVRRCTNWQFKIHSPRSSLLSTWSSRLFRLSRCSSSNHVCRIHTVSAYTWTGIDSGSARVGILNITKLDNWQSIHHIWTGRQGNGGICRKYRECCCKRVSCSGFHHYPTITLRYLANFKKRSRFQPSNCNFSASQSQTEESQLYLEASNTISMYLLTHSFVLYRLISPIASLRWGGNYETSMDLMMFLDLFCHLYTHFEYCLFVYWLCPV